MPANIKFKKKWPVKPMESFDEWQPPFKAPSLFELEELNITAGR
jgi:hypothetical protein